MTDTEIKQLDSMDMYNEWAKLSMPKTDCHAVGAAKPQEAKKT